MSLDTALLTARSGLLHTQRALASAANNVANADTPGYTRKTVAGLAAQSQALAGQDPRFDQRFERTPRERRGLEGDHAAVAAHDRSHRIQIGAPLEREIDVGRQHRKHDQAGESKKAARYLGSAQGDERGET